MRYDIVVRVDEAGAEGDFDEGRELRSLARWLRDDDAIRTTAIVELRSAPTPSGAMGNVFDAVQLTADSGFQLANLALAYVTWRAGRRRPPAVTIEHEGVRVELDTADPDEVARLLAALRQDR
ncbi:hypothetical protein [Streptomyces sp. NPDC094032]|uniref:effector-associated constant component EACC1 n=1 Tax=Streptomyces sp. NPDC094032 TaxID=3155308 RepID=UPI003321F330